MNSLPNSVPSVLSPFASAATFSAYDWSSACLLFPWQEPTQKTRPTTTTIAIAIRPTRRASGTRPVGAGRRGRGGGGGPPPPAPPAGPLEPRQATPLRRLDGLGLVEEVEFDVVVV